jgi:hypothetical protein
LTHLRRQFFRHRRITPKDFSKVFSGGAGIQVMAAAITTLITARMRK